jgi:hypothetical protein
MGRCHAPHPSRNHRLGSAGCSPMALTAPPRICGPGFLAPAWATAYATPAPSSRRHVRPSRRLSARPGARRCPRGYTGCDSGEACGSVRSASSDAALRIMSPPRLEWPTANGCDHGSRPRKQAGMPGSQTPGCRCDQHPTGASAQRDRPEVVPDEGVPSSRRKPASVAHGAGAFV